MIRTTLFPPIEPFRTGQLKVSELHEIFYEEVGNPHGIPIVFLHGGPGVGIMPDYRRFFDPQAYHVVLPDQRGAGRSTPHAELRENTTWALVDDLEQLREHLGIQQWILFGGSWGSTLALCYAETHPDSVSDIILRGVFLGRQLEVNWLHKFGMSEIYPDEWEKYQFLVPPGERNDMVKAYYALLTAADAEMQMRAAASWSRWEAATMNVQPDHSAISAFTDGPMALSIGRIECHYTYHRFFFDSDNFILDHAHTIEHIPCRIVQGRYDVICPVRAAWDLHRILPKSELVIVTDGAHSPMDEGMIRELVRATEEFKELQA